MRQTNRRAFRAIETGEARALMQRPRAGWAGSRIRSPASCRRRRTMRTRGRRCLLRNWRNSFPLSGFQKWTDLSTVTIDRPSGENTASPIAACGPVWGRISRLLATSQSRIILSSADVATVFPSGARTAWLVRAFPIPMRRISFPVSTSQSCTKLSSGCRGLRVAMRP